MRRAVALAAILLSAAPAWSVGKPDQVAFHLVIANAVPSDAAKPSLRRRQIEDLIR